MTLFQLIVIALIQGLTEFLPVSSSGHLVLLPELTSLDDQGVVIDVAVHVGTLFAVVLYFWSDVQASILGLGRLVQGRVDTPGARLALNLIIATIPVIIAGFLLHITGLAEMLRSVAVIGWTMLIFGIVLYWADQTGGNRLETADWNWRHAIIMGLWQAVALIPGTSRSGITITGARQLGYDRQSAARLAMLMSIPTIAASGLLLSLDVAAAGDAAMTRSVAIAAFLAFISALLALSLLMRLLRSVSYTPFVIYRVILGVVLLIYAYAYA